MDPTFRQIAQPLQSDGTEPNAEMEKVQTRSPSVAPTSRNRLSQLFWGVAVEEEAVVKSDIIKSKIVSQPVALPEMGGSLRFSTLSAEQKKVFVGLGISDGDELETDFNDLMNDLGIKGPQREAMLALDSERKRFLLAQHRGPAPVSTPQLRPTKTGVDSEGTFATLKRYSLVGWAVGNSEEAKETVSATESRQLASPVIDGTPPMPKSPNFPAPGESGLSWSSWWTMASNATGTGASTTEAKDTPSFYVDQLTSSKISQRSLVKHLIALRVRLSTSKLSWTEEFLERAKGLEALECLIERIAINRMKHREGQTDEDETIQIESIKCLRVLTNTEIGSSRIIARERLVNVIAYSLFTTSNKLRALVADLLGNLSKFSHFAVLAALSEFRVVHNENYRFEYLIECLAVREEEDGEADGFTEPVIWEWRTAGLSMINGLVIGLEELSERTLIREEFGRRGLNEVITGLRYLSPPDFFLAQVEVYIEGKRSDQSNVSNLRFNGSSFDNFDETVSELLDLAQEHEGLRYLILDVARLYVKIGEKQIDDDTKMKLNTLIGNFIESADTLEDLNGFEDFMNRYLASISQIVGRYDIYGAIIFDRRSASERREGSEVQDQVRCSDSGVVQRLALKEKQVIELEAEVSELTKFPKPIEDSGSKRMRMEQNLQWSGLMQEIGSNKVQISELENQLEERGKDIMYLKRALETVYARFKPAETELDQSPGETEPSIIVNHTIEALNQKDLNITALKEEIMKLKSTLIAQRKLPSAFGRVAPPPPLVPSTSSDQSIKAPKQKVVSSPAIRKVSSRPLMIPISESATTFSPASTASPSIPQAPPPPPYISAVSAQTQTSSFIPTAPPTPQFVAGSSPSPPITKIETTRPARPSFLDAIQKKKPVTTIVESDTPSRPPSLFLNSITKSKEAESMPERPKLPFLGAIGKRVEPANSAARPPQPFLPSLSSSNVASGNRNPTPLLDKNNAAPVVDSTATRPTILASIPVKPRPLVPQKKMKPFFWNKLTPINLEKSVWSEIDSIKSLDLTDLETSFAIVPVTPKPSAVGGDGSVKKNVTTLLGLGRANNISIMLARFKLSHAAIREALLNLDDGKLSIDNLLAIKHYVPTTDEIESIRAFEGEITTLASSDQYFNEIMTIPRLSERLTCMLYRRKLEMDMEELLPELTILRFAADELKYSAMLKRLLAAILAIGNKLNASTFRGDANGFQLDSLLKLKETRSTNSSADTPTLLHYLVRVILKSEPGLLRFLEEASHVEAASRTSFITVMGSIHSLTSGLALVQEEVRILKRIRISPAEDQFITTMEVFVKQALPAIEALGRMGSKLELDLKNLIGYYGEDSNSTKPEDIFSTITAFSTSLLRTEIEIKSSDKKLKTSIDIKTGKKLVVSVDSESRESRVAASGFRRARATLVAPRPISRVFLDGTNR